MKHSKNPWDDLSEAAQKTMFHKYSSAGGEAKAFTSTKKKGEAIGEFLERRYEATGGFGAVEVFCKDLNICHLDYLRLLLWNNGKPVAPRAIYDHVCRLYELKMQEEKEIFLTSSALSQWLTSEEVALINGHIASDPFRDAGTPAAANTTTTTTTSREAHDAASPFNLAPPLPSAVGATAGVLGDDKGSTSSSGSSANINNIIHNNSNNSLKMPKYEHHKSHSRLSTSPDRKSGFGGNPFRRRSVIVTGEDFAARFAEAFESMGSQSDVSSACGAFDERSSSVIDEDFTRRKAVATTNNNSSSSSSSAATATSTAAAGGRKGKAEREASYLVRPAVPSSLISMSGDAETLAMFIKTEPPLRWDDKDAVDYWSSRFSPRERWVTLTRDQIEGKSLLVLPAAYENGWNIEFSPVCVTHSYPETRFSAIIDGVNDYPYYREFIAKGPHDNYVAKDGPCIVSVESKPKAGTSCKAIVRTALHTERILLPPENPMKALQFLVPIVASYSFAKVKSSSIVDALVGYDEKQYTKSHKIGILYCKNRVKDENDLFSAKEGSPAYNEFLEFLGEKVRLKGWNKYSGGLDIEGKTKKNNNKNKEIITTITSLHICLDDLTGEYSVYSEFRGHEIMYHVCTILPLKEKDTQRVDRKRHIGNDVVVIVFKDSSDKDDAFDPNIFKSHFICNSLNSPHFSTFVYFCFIIIIFVFVCTDSVFVITPMLKEDGTTGHYQISIANKSCVPPYPPFGFEGYIFEKDTRFKDYLLAKRKKKLHT